MKSLAFMARVEIAMVGIVEKGVFLFKPIFVWKYFLFNFNVYRFVPNFIRRHFILKLCANKARYTDCSTSINNLLLLCVCIFNDEVRIHNNVACCCCVLLRQATISNKQHASRDFLNIVVPIYINTSI